MTLVFIIMACIALYFVIGVVVSAAILACFRSVIDVYDRFDTDTYMMFVLFWWLVLPLTVLEAFIRKYMRGWIQALCRLMNRMAAWRS